MTESVRVSPQLFIIKRPVFLIVGLCLLWNRASSAGVGSRCHNNDIDCYDLDYEAEDAARAELLFDQRLKEIARNVEISTTEHPNLQEFIKLCLHEKEVVDCNKSPSTDYACLGSEGLTKCADVQGGMNHSMCADKIYRRVMECGFLSLHFFCYVVEKQTSIIGFCEDAEKYICLSDVGNLQLCQNPTPASDIITSPGQFSGIKELHKLDDFTKNVLKRKPFLFEMNSTSLNTSEYLATSTNHKGSLTLTIDKDSTILSTPEIASTRLIISQGRSSLSKIFTTPIPMVHISENKTTLSNVPTEETFVNKKVNLSNDTDMQVSPGMSAALINWYSEWYPFGNSTRKVIEGKPILTCTGKESITSDLCKKNTNIKACVGVLSGKIMNCEEHNKTETLIPVCKEDFTRNIITCGDFVKAYLCFSDGFEEAFLKPCLIKERQACLDEKGVLKNCLEGEPTTLVFVYKEEPVMFDNFSTELCKSEKFPDILFECNKETNASKACLERGKIEECKEFYSKNLTVPVCLDESSRKVMTCESHPRTYLCFPRRQNTGRIKLCNIENRQICLNWGGRLQKCLESVAQFEVIETDDSIGKETDKNYYSPEWSNFWQEWAPGGVHAAKNEDMEIVDLCMPRKSRLYMNECRANETHLNICILAKTGLILQCQQFEETDMIVPLCKELSSKRIITCGDFTRAPLCASDPSDKNGSIMVPCMDKERELCLIKDGNIDFCSTLINSNTRVKQNEKNMTKDAYSDKMHDEEGVQIETKHLCVSRGFDNLEECEGDQSQPVACIHAKKFIIASCREIEEMSEVGIPVCLKKKSSELVTCGKFSHANLCYPRGKNYQSELKPCNTKKSRMACLTKDGSIKKCSEMLIGDSEDKRNKNVAMGVFLKRAKRASEYQFQSLDFLCMKNKNKQLVSCQLGKEKDNVCLHTSSGEIVACNKISSGEMSIALCIERTSNKLYTCEKFNKVNVCILSGKNPYGTCRSKDYFACVKNGQAERCSTEETTSRSYKRQKNLTHYWIPRVDQNEKRVYKAEEAIMNATMKGLTRLCRNDVQKFLVCEDSPGLEFLCLVLKDGLVKTCEETNVEVYVMPICMETNTKKVTLCGKHYKGNLCARKNNKGHYLETCSTSNEQTCLTEKGELSKCVDMNKTNETISEEETSEKTKEKDENDEGEVEEWDEDIMEENDDYYSDFDDEFDEEKSERPKNTTVIVEYDDYKSYSETTTDNDLDEENKNGSESTYASHINPQSENDYKEDRTHKVGKLNDIESNAAKTIDHFHRLSKHLCSQERRNNGDQDIIDCNKVQEIEFACVGSKNGKIQNCDAFDDLEPVFPVCSWDETNILVTCDVISNLRLCFGDNGKTKVEPCAGRPDSICVTPDGKQTTCENDYGTTTPGSKVVGERSSDEKFLRFHCRDCEIENTLVVVGTPHDVLPEIEVITFPSN